MIVQDWDIINLDKRQRLDEDETSQPLGTALFSGLYDKLFKLIATPSNPSQRSQQEPWSWAGDRIICTGNFTDDYPAGLLTEKELKELSDFDCNLHSFAAENYDTSDTTDAPVPGGPPWMLRNISKREYVRSGAFELANYVDGSMDRPPPGLIEALVVRICWGSDGNTFMVYYPRWPGTRPIHRGLWAGDRFDIIAGSEFEDKQDGWEDVSDAVRKEVFAIWASEVGEDVVRSWKMKAARKSASPIVPFSPFNMDICRYIMEIAAKEDIVTALNLASVSRLARAWITGVIYQSVILDRNPKLAAFCTALQLNPNLGGEVRRLFIRAPNHRAPVTSYEVISATLRRCTGLELLITDIATSSITYIDDQNTSSHWPELRHLMMIPFTKPLSHIDHPLLHNITHVCMNFDNLAVGLPALFREQLPKLTHIALFTHFERMESWGYASTVNILRSYPSLKVVLLVQHSYLDLPKAPLVGDSWTDIVQIQDQRLFARPGLDVDDWEDTMKHGTTIFDDVETKYKNWRNTLTTTNES